MSNFFQKHGTWIPIKAFLILIIIALSILVLVGSYLLHNAFASMGIVEYQNINNQTTSFIDYQISENEKQIINTWLLKSNLNEYGDPANTQYQENPLSDNTTGETIDRYRLILNKFPKRPWNKNN
ncbi:MAG: hypothetical protein UT11_C0008G0013 [Berkelbacteria bacterium GW2011_GWA2_38_9]|uniref:Uncharacterized protein n=1 Tax=Berkelbacteria bacterium GW2011_GWA2_38_9 TaxID=1618334 RepID=A0A0G0LQR8_9BACT|nr:MAG: hypothetical protein UT11_C0008G0013 [Berkelbacteria bacterium GW2011_GWA2_38_9]